ncbi:hypothetical protein IT568_06065 [bacterium]|nr:hypothetical protein [bacterium]
MSKKILPFTSKNFIYFGVGILLLLFGFISLAQGPVDGWLSLTLAPVLLVFGYCVVIPIAILLSDKKKGF